MTTPTMTKPDRPKKKRTVPPGDRALHDQRVERFQIACEALRTSPTGVITALGASASTWSHYANRSSNPDWSWWRTICDHLGVCEDWLLNGRGPMTQAESQPMTFDGSGIAIPVLGEDGVTTQGTAKLPEGCAVMRLASGESFLVAQLGQRPSVGDLVLHGQSLRKVVSISRGALVVEDPDAENPALEVLLPSDAGGVRVVLGELF